MPHMLAQEHLGYTDAIRYSASQATTDATITAALAAIGSTQTTLILSNVGTGIWTINNPISCPQNVTLMIPSGVTVNGTANLTLYALIAFTELWYTGSGTVTINTTGQSGFVVNGLKVQANAAVGLVGIGSKGGVAHGLWYDGGSDNIFTFEHIGNVGGYTEWIWVDGTGAAQTLQRKYNTGQNAFGAVAGTHQITLSSDSAAKPSTNTWTISSDKRLKTILRPFTDGLALLKQLKSYWYTYNGKAGHTVDGVEHISIMAQDLQPLAPYMVGSYKHKLEPADAEETDILTYEGHALPFVLANALQELADQVEALTARITALEGGTQRQAPPRHRPARAKKSPPAQ